MAPRSTPSTRGRGSDGDKGRSSPPANDSYAYNADERAKKRESAPVTVGGLDFRRRRKNWEVTRGLRALLRRQEAASTRMQRVRKQIDELPLEDESGLDAFHDQLDTIQDDGDRAAYEILALLLKDEEGKSPDVEFLMNELDVSEAGDLANNLSSGDEPVSGPTETEPS